MTTPAQPGAPATGGLVDPTGAERVVQDCHGCGTKDDHPRHVIYDGVVRARPDGSQQFVDLSTVKHLDCCAADGCGHCGTVLEHAGERRGQELLDFLHDAEAMVPVHKALFERHGTESANHVIPPDTEQPVSVTHPATGEIVHPSELVGHPSAPAGGSH